MTEIFFIRHSKVEYTAEDTIRPLSEEGKKLLPSLVQAFDALHVDRMISSPYKRAIDTILPIAHNKGLTIECYDELRERKVSDRFIDDFKTFSERQWADFNYKLPGGESLNEVQSRGLLRIENILKVYDGETIIIGTHGTFLAILLKWFNQNIDFEFWKSIQSPDIIKVTFKGSEYIAMEQIAF